MRGAMTNITSTWNRRVNVCREEVCVVTIVEVSGVCVWWEGLRLEGGCSRDLVDQDQVVNEGDEATSTCVELGTCREMKGWEDPCGLKCKGTLEPG
jgi:hypothetical protein